MLFLDVLTPLVNVTDESTSDGTEMNQNASMITQKDLSALRIEKQRSTNGLGVYPRLDTGWQVVNRDRCYLTPLTISAQIQCDMNEQPDWAGPTAIVHELSRPSQVRHKLAIKL